MTVVTRASSAHQARRELRPSVAANSRNIRLGLTTSRDAIAVSRSGNDIHLTAATSNVEPQPLGLLPWAKHEIVTFLSEVVRWKGDIRKILVELKNKATISSCGATDSANASVPPVGFISFIQSKINGYDRTPLPTPAARSSNGVLASQLRLLHFVVDSILCNTELLLQGT
ncbi:hypothetical protein B0H14DRAFT_2568882 [Mycena olivaceomarginata]|nr:hypothetical protein B0H14DRAFT_2568882 [Mycena olivaceomarginata]